MDIKVGDYVLCFGEADDIFKVVKLREGQAALIGANGFDQGWEDLDKLTVINEDEVVRKVQLKWERKIMAIDDKSTYYDAGGIEVMAIIKAKLTSEQFKGFLLGNIMKYSLRLNYKGQALRDCEKIFNYSMQLIDQLAKDTV